MCKRSCLLQQEILEVPRCNASAFLPTPRMYSRRSRPTRHRRVFQIGDSLLPSLGKAHAAYRHSTSCAANTLEPAFVGTGRMADKSLQLHRDRPKMKSLIRLRHLRIGRWFSFVFVTAVGRGNLRSDTTPPIALVGSSIHPSPRFCGGAC